MKSYLFILLLISHLSGFSQNQISTFETKIVRSFPPRAFPDVYTQWDQNMRTIQWHEPIANDYLYSNQAFDTIGYEALVSNENTDTRTYRNCFKGITVEIKEYEGQLSITMCWFSFNNRNAIGDLSTCSEFIGTWEQIPDTSIGHPHLIIKTISGGGLGYQNQSDYFLVPKIPFPLRYKNGLEPFKQENTLESYTTTPHLKIELTFNVKTQHLTLDNKEYIKVPEQRSSHHYEIGGAH